MKDIYLSIVIPAYNEADRLPRTLVATITYLEKQPFTSEIVIVNEGKDNTPEVVEFFQRIYPAISILSFDQRQGKGKGTKIGMLAAKGQVRHFMDADLAVPVEYIGDCLKQIQSGADIAIGSRSVPGARIVHSQRFPRHELALLFGYLQRAVLQLPLVDTQCGFKMFTADAAKKYFSVQTLDCAFFDTEILYLAYNMNSKIAEVPVQWWHDDHTRLPIGPGRSLELAALLFQIRRTHSALLASAKMTASSAGLPD
jgi:glycosyltransferase involved in cell wall biosynthesis